MSYQAILFFDSSLSQFGILRKKGMQWGINYKFSEKITMAPATKTVLHEVVIVERYNFINILHHGKKGIKWDINYNFSEKLIMAVAAETVLREDVIGKA
jgi:hypothetical protein